MAPSSDCVCVILAGGRGSRMDSRDLNKVCFPVAGTPAIVRAIDAYKAAGLSNFLVVVGQMAEQVITTVAAAHPRTCFVYQSEQHGTGDAAARAVNALTAQNYTGSVMIVMGDKVSTPSMAHRLLERYRRKAADVLLTTAPKSEASTAGRVVCDDRGRMLGIVEAADIRRARARRTKITVAGRAMTADQIERRSPTVNLSMYLFRFEALREALGHLATDNAQGELYLTDTVAHIAANGRADALCLRDPTHLMAFNTPAELLAVENVVRTRQKPSRVKATGRKRLTRRTCKPAGQWLRIVEGDSADFRTVLRATYGRDDELIRERRAALKRLLATFIRRYGPERPAILVRAPGRANLMGRHVDHRGGYANVMAISRETLLAAAPRDDDLVTLRNLKARQFPVRKFRIFDLLREASWADWMEFVESRTVRDVLQSAPGDWSHYARAPLMRLQHECKSVPLKGMDCVVSGNIPIGAGLSSSSALVVAFAEAAVALNRLNLETSDFVSLCGEGEWFTGTPAGRSAYAGIRTGRFGRVTRIGFFPFRILGEAALPGDLSLVVAYSGSQAAKGPAARDIYNHRVGSFDLAEMYLRRTWPAAAGIEHLRDLTPENLKVEPGEIYRALARLPRRATRTQLRRSGRLDRNRLDEIFATHRDQGGYDLRGMALYGISEVLRSQRFARALKRGDMATIGQFMRASHDGDRVVRFDADGRPRRHVVRLTDARLEQLAAEPTDLAGQSGRYACSTEAIDHLVDVGTGCDGVVGAQLAGAGLGGCVMILVRAGALDPLKRHLRKRFYAPRKLRTEIHVCTPVAGAGLLSGAG